MNSFLLLKEEGWDAPFFKKLASNDTGDSPGHQGGLVIPKDIRNFFPTLEGEVSAVHPTIDYQIKALLFVDGKYFSTVNTRYQFQTWGGTRSPESRLTSNLGQLRSHASNGDYLIFQRSLEYLDLYRFFLITKSNPEYHAITAIIRRRKWGLIDEIPLSQNDITSSQQDERNREARDFVLFDQEDIHNETVVKRRARSIVFRSTVQNIYSNLCVVCNSGLKSPYGQLEVQAAHIIPKKYKGTDDARNGIVLCQRHHWAFDNGLFGIDNNRKVYIPKIVRICSKNKPLIEFEGINIREANRKDLMASQDAFDWHKKHIVERQ